MSGYGRKKKSNLALRRHYHICLHCGKRVRLNTRVVQLAEGPVSEGFVTPGYGKRDIRGLWHEKCVVGPLQAHCEQEQPYFCEVCGRSIQHRTSAVYAVAGSYAGAGYVRPERRGYSLRLVAHPECCDDGPQDHFLQGKATIAPTRILTAQGPRGGWLRVMRWAGQHLRALFRRK